MVGCVGLVLGFGLYFASCYMAWCRYGALGVALCILAAVGVSLAAFCSSLSDK